MTIEIALMGEVAIGRTGGTGEGSAGRRRLRGAQQGVALAMLVLERPGGVTRDALADALWPDGLPATWPTALRNIVSRVRAAVASALPGAEDPVLLEAGRYRLHLPQDVLIDVEVAAADVAAAHQALRTGDVAGARRLADGAVDVLREPFLVGGGDGAWVTARRAHLTELCIAGLEVVSRAGSAAGDHLAALVAAQEAVALAPLRESAHRCVIGAFAAAGNRAEALRAYHSLRQTLAEELGVDPSPETEAAYLDLLGAQPVATPPVDRSSVPGIETGGIRLHHADELADMVETWIAATRGRLQAVVVSGAARVGTSRLVAEAARTATASGGLVLFGDGDPTAPARFPPLVEALDGLLAARGPELLPTRPGAVAQLRRVFPALGGAPSAGEPDDDVLFGEAVAEVLLAVTADRPAMLVLDDLAWDDERSLSWLLRLVARAASARLLLVLLTRDDTSGGATRLAELLASVAPDVRSVRSVRSVPSVGSLASAHQTGGLPPRPTTPRTPGRLPAYTTSFVGREAECARLLPALRSGRLVTLTGEGGIGKSRLAVEAAQRAPIADYPDGVRFCDISSVPDRESLVEHVAAAVGLGASTGEGLRKALVASLEPLQLLLIIDNCEVLAPAVRELVDDVLPAAPDLRILAASRAPLRAKDEQVLRVQPLDRARPDSDGDGDGDGGRASTAPPAVQLLVDRAVAAGAVVGDDDPALDEIVRQLDAIPLAIELVAPRLATAPAAVVADRLDRHFDLLDEPNRASGHARHGALRATIDWSYTLLDHQAQQLFAGLSVFEGGWTLETAAPVAEALCLDRDVVPSLLAELAEQSMIRLETSAAGAVRYASLATLRAHGADQLGRSSRGVAVAGRHAAHFVDLAEQTVAQRRGPREAACVTQLATEFDNLRAAYRWAVHTGRSHDALRLVAALGYDAVLREWFEVGRWASELAARPDVADDPLRAVALALASNVALVENRFDDAERLSVASLESERRTGGAPCWMSRYTLAWLTAVEATEGDWRSHLDAMVDIGTAAGEPLAIALSDFVRVRLRVYSGRPERGRARAERLLQQGADLACPTILAMGLLAHGLSVGDAEPDIATSDFQSAFEVASSAHNILLAHQALRASEQLNARSDDPTTVLTALRSIARRFERWGNAHEQVNTILSMLEPLVASGALVETARICGALARTPWAPASVLHRVERTLAERLPVHEYSSARAAGALMPVADLVPFVSSLVDDIVERDVGRDVERAGTSRSDVL